MAFYKFVMLLILISATAYGQPRQTKVWDKNDPLRWDDFIGSTDQSSPYDAVTHSGDTVFYHWQQRNGQYKIDFNGYCLMFMNRSWVKTGKQTSQLLVHEQTHFDISEFFWRQLLEALNQHTFTPNFKEEISLIHQEASKERHAMQALYDEQTRHSKNRPMQKKWEEYVKDILDNNYTLEEALQKEPTE